VKENPKFLAWMDLETTGSSPVSESVIEVALVVTDPDLNIRERRTWTVMPRMEDHLLLMDPVVVDMHIKNGLLAEVLKREGVILDIADKAVSKALEPYLTNGKIPLAGSGVSHFDRRFIRRYMPHTEKRLTYAPYDIGSVRRFARLAGRKIEDRPLTHRALDDVLDHIEEARSYIEMLRLETQMTLFAGGRIG
jgi:oligoribonuclease